VKGSPDYYVIGFASVEDVSKEQVDNIRALSEAMKQNLFSVPTRTVAQHGI
jgi:hypothetical protein